MAKNSAVQELIKGLQEDLSREYQAIIAYTVYSNVLTRAKWMNIAGQLKKRAHEKLEHARIRAVLHTCKAMGDARSALTGRLRGPAAQRRPDAEPESARRGWRGHRRSGGKPDCPGHARSISGVPNASPIKSIRKSRIILRVVRRA